MVISYEIAFMDIEPGPPFCPFDYLSVQKMEEGEWVRQERIVKSWPTDRCGQSDSHRVVPISEFEVGIGKRCG